MIANTKSVIGRRYMCPMSASNAETTKFNLKLTSKSPIIRLRLEARTYKNPGRYYYTNLSDPNARSSLLNMRNMASA
jgi:hypothetical protein